MDNYIIQESTGSVQSRGYSAFGRPYARIETTSTTPVDGNLAQTHAAASVVGTGHGEPSPELVWRQPTRQNRQELRQNPHNIVNQEAGDNISCTPSYCRIKDRIHTSNHTDDSCKELNAISDSYFEQKTDDEGPQKFTRLREAFSAAELSTPLFYRDILAEALVSAIYLAFIVFSLTTLNPQAYRPNTTHSGLLVGIIVFLLIEAFGHISGCHINPAVSWVMLLNGKITIIRALVYSIAQVCGSLAGAMLAYRLIPPGVRGYIHPFQPADGLSPLSAVAIELVLTFNLIFVALSTFDARRRVVTMPALPTGLSIGCGIFAAGTYTGGCMNPIVALGPAFVTGNFHLNWVYWAGAYAGATLAFLVYTAFSTIETGFPTHQSDRRNTTAKDEQLKEELKTLLYKLNSE